MFLHYSAKKGFKDYSYAKCAKDLDRIGLPIWLESLGYTEVLRWGKGFEENLTLVIYKQTHNKRIPTFLADLGDIIGDDHVIPVWTFLDDELSLFKLRLELAPLIMADHLDYCFEGLMSLLLQKPDILPRLKSWGSCVS